MPTLDEVNAAAPETPVFILHLYCRALLNKAALRACGYTKDTPNPPGGEIQHDSQGNPTGLLIARPNALILYATLAKGPKLPPEHQMNSTRHYMRELNRLGLTSIIDAGGGFQNYPEDYSIIEELHRKGELTLCIACNLFTQKPKQEKEDFARWIKMTAPGKGDDFYRCNGAGQCWSIRRRKSLLMSGKSLERLLTALGEPTEVRGRPPPRGPPYFGSKVVRQKLFGLSPEPGLFD
jgi:predicted amidohydrolase YtcJ